MTESRALTGPEIVERVAKVLHDRDERIHAIIARGDPRRMLSPWMLTPEAARETWLQESRAAVLSLLDAIREPNQAALRATDSINDCMSELGQCYNEAEIWRAMIDALKREIAE